jgi:hypothetical protein
MGHVSFWSALMMLIYWAEMYTFKKNTEVLLTTSREAEMEVTIQKPKCWI